MTQASKAHREQDEGGATPGVRVISERVARAAARALLAANQKAGIESTPKTKELASGPRL